MTEAGPEVSRPDGVVLIAIWFILGAVFAMIGAAALAIFAIPAVVSEVEGDGRYFAMAGIGFGLFVIVLAGVADVIAAIGVLRLRPWGRWLAIVLAALGLFLFPVGTVVGVLIIWYLLGDEAKVAFGVMPPPGTASA